MGAQADCFVNELTLMDDVTSSLRLAVDEFQKSVTREHIDMSDEKEKQAKAREAVEKFEETCAEVENLVQITDNKVRIRNIQKLVKDVRGANEGNIETFQTAMSRYTSRAGQYEKCSPLSRRFFSPRDKAADDVWSKDNENVNSGMNCFLVTLAFFGLLMMTSILLQVDGYLSRYEPAPQPMKRFYGRLFSASVSHSSNLTHGLNMDRKCSTSRFPVSAEEVIDREL